MYYVCPFLSALHILIYLLVKNFTDRWHAIVEYKELQTGSVIRTVSFVQ